MTQLFIPTLISHLFEPMVVLTAITVAGAFASGLTGPILIRFIILLVVGLTVPVALFRIWIVETKKVGDWDIHKRRERIKPLAVLMAVSFFSVLVVSHFNSPFLTQLFTMYLVWIAGFFAVTLFWKISGHASIATLGVLLFIKWFGLAYLPLLIAIPLVGWARVLRKDHTLAQVIAGTVYSSLLVWFFP